MHDVSGWEIRLDPVRTRALRSSGVWRNRTIGHDARRRAEAEPDRVCMRDAHRSVTFRQALEEAEALACSLWSLGLRPGDVVSFQLPNWIEAGIINLAAALLGLVSNPIVPIYRETETTSIIRDCGAKVLFVPDILRRFDHVDMAERIRASTRSLQHVVVVKPSAPPGPRVLDYSSLVGATGGVAPWPDVAADAVKFVLYTSGTTGVAKGVLHTHETIGRALQGCMEFWGIAPSDSILMPSPVTHQL